MENKNFVGLTSTQKHSGYIEKKWGYTFIYVNSYMTNFRHNENKKKLFRVVQKKSAENLLRVCSAIKIAI